MIFFFHLVYLCFESQMLLSLIKKEIYTQKVIEASLLDGFYIIRIEIERYTSESLFNLYLSHGFVANVERRYRKLLEGGEVISKYRLR